MHSKSASLLVVFVIFAATIAMPPGVFAETADEADLAKVQGTWERKTGEDVTGMHRATKEIHGTHEVITYYGAGDEILRSHEVDFRLETRDGVKIFTFSSRVETAGPEKGSKASEAVSYIYRADENTFVEVWGFVPGQEQRTPRMLMWVRKPPASEATRGELLALQGTWMVKPEQDQKAAASKETFGDEMAINGDDFVIRKNKRVFLKGVIRLEPIHNPKSIDMIITQSPNGMKNGQCVRGIYESKDGELRWCGSLPNHPRPHEFVVREGSAQSLVALRREEPSGSLKP